MSVLLKSNLIFSFFHQRSIFSRPQAQEEDGKLGDSRMVHNGKECDNGKKSNDHNEDNDDGGNNGK